MAIKITIVSTKGGVGKTTLSANLGGLLADRGVGGSGIGIGICPGGVSCNPVLQLSAAH